MKKLLLVLCPIAIIALLFYATNASSKASKADKETYEQYYINEELKTETTDDKFKTSESTDVLEPEISAEDPMNTVDLDPTSITVLVNKSYTLDPDYEPDDLVVPKIKFSFSRYDPKMQLRAEAASAIENLFNDALKEGIVLAGVSGYRSYKRQYEIYVTNLIRRGIDFTNQYSAMPGASEHQTGLAMDISTSSINYRLTDSFATTKEGIWVAKNCHKYGFVVRFQADKTDKTGYSYEPWHIRYVGVELATYLTEHNLCLDEYYNYVYDDQIYANLDYDAFIKEYYAMKGINYASSSISKPNKDQANPGNIDDFEDLEENLIEPPADVLTPTDSPETNENTQDTTSDKNEHTQSPTNKPSNEPTVTPSNKPSSKPTDKPSKPTSKPTDPPTSSPTDKPVVQPNPPTQEPTPSPSDTPTPSPDVTEPPSAPNDTPTMTPTPVPTEDPLAHITPIADPNLSSERGDSNNLITSDSEHHSE